MHKLASPPPVVITWLSKWTAIGGTIAMIDGKAFPWRLAKTSDPDAISEIALRAEFMGNPWMERGVRVAVIANARSLAFDLVERGAAVPWATNETKKAGLAAAAIAWAERKRRARASGDLRKLVPEIHVLKLRLEPENKGKQ